MAEEFQKVTLNLSRSDYARLAVLHPQTPKAVIIRMIVQAYIVATETNAAMILEDVKAQP